ncbi:MAG: EAL domain-containing protein [Eubacterium sp.]|nr:EAL domain-containing protein [Eubacterium sp.]MCM1215795.1 EAL domain-containing protein [Lachnospiraceae bacterium]MCM1304120.1 EAL domain-containing protein [Butyrivibrio sp.]MCM1344078.1 EAL domain-containing protein [Muribaculaceae bacterium]MCM1238357.1 EAL domain-containing protein [Lachnospiraceae bacterium]
MKRIRKSKTGRTSRFSALRFGFALLSVIALLAALPAGNLKTVHGAEKRTVRVGFFPMDGYNEFRTDGSHGGMDVEYLEALCDYVSWNIEYVECASWGDALDMLLNREIDLVGSAQYSRERAELYRYADLASGYTFGAVAVNSDSTLAYEDFDAMEDATFGVVGSYIRKDEFYEYLADHGILSPNVREYQDTAALQAALDKGEIDALVHSLTEIREGQRVIGRFAPMPFYYISWLGNDDLMRELNQGIADVKMNRPELENELMVKYYDSRLDQTILLTNDEKQYIAAREELTVGYLDDYYPFSYESGGEYMGLARQVLEEVSVSTGIRFDYVRLDGMEDAKAALKDGSIDILSYCGEASKSLKAEGLAVTKVYAQVPQVIIMRRNSKSDAITTLAVEESGALEAAVQDFTEEGTRLLPFPSQLESLYAVKDGSADAAMCDGYLAEYLLGSQLRFNKMEIHSVLSDVHDIYMVVAYDEESPLLGILNKELLEVSDKMVNDYMLQDNFYSKMSLANFISDHSIPILLILSCCAVAVILVLFFLLRNSIRVQKLMYKDTEFDVWNLNYLRYRAAKKLAADKGHNYAIAYTDIGQFKSYNALYGWSAGQKILEIVIETLSQEVDSGQELYARSYGSHFVLFVRYEDVDSLKKRLMGIADRISARIHAETGIHMYLSMGVGCLEDGDNGLRRALSECIQLGDSLKNSYGNTVQIYDDRLRAKLKEDHEREKLLESVDINKDFVAFYQAKVDIRNERIVGAEALVRFKDPTAGGAIRAPGFFVPYYERTGRIRDIDFFVMESVCKMLRRRLDAGQNVVPVSCNFSRMHFIEDSFPKKFEAVIDKYQVPKELIEVEITETLVVEEVQQQKVKEIVDTLREKGVRLSIDDFGSGYSSLGVFEQIPASVIKLDRSFLLNNENRTRQVSIMKNIVNLAKDLNAQVVCEGVETENDTELMMEIGAYVAQGYRYSKPVAEDVFEAMLNKGN